MKRVRFIPFLILVLAASLATAPALAQDTETTTSSTPTTPVSAETTETSSSGGTLQEGIVRPDNGRQSGEYESARLIETHIETEGSEKNGTQKQSYEIEIRSGSLKGTRHTISSDIDANPYQIQPRVGDKLVIFIQRDDNGNPLIYLEGFDRRTALIWLVVLFVLSLILLAGWQGLKVACSIAVSIGTIGWILIPAFLKGINPVPIAMMLAGTLTFVSTGLSLGWGKKSRITAISTLGGVLIAYILSLIFAHWGHLSGLATEEDRLFFGQNPSLNPHGLLFAGIIIAAMGMIEDVAVSIASGVEQVAKANPSMTFKSLFVAGMTVGKDHTSAMANTLIFAYVGASLSTLLLYSQYDASWLKFLNFESVSVEVIQALTATIGLVFTVPIAALLSAWRMPTERKRKNLVHIERQ